jgi:multimeric flavodoxin WrbA
MYMKLMLFNGSPRKTWNTSLLLNAAKEGAASRGAEIDLIHLYDLHYKGCISCFACKRIGGISYGKCAVKDDLTEIFARVEEADALIIGSPIYYGAVTGATRSFLERLMFQYSVYDTKRSSLFKKRIFTGFLYTMGANELQMKEMGYAQNVKATEVAMKRIFGHSESIFVTDTYQFEDYSRYVTTLFNVEEKIKSRQEQFPKDCEKAFNMGARFAES